MKNYPKGGEGININDLLKLNIGKVIEQIDFQERILNDIFEIIRNNQINDNNIINTLIIKLNILRILGIKITIKQYNKLIYELKNELKNDVIKLNIQYIISRINEILVEKIDIKSQIF